MKSTTGLDPKYASIRSTAVQVRSDVLFSVEFPVKISLQGFLGQKFGD
jgi:hypothetical protein